MNNISKESKTKGLIIGGAVLITVAIHYGWLLEPIFGSSHWIHALHGRFCYIPIVIAASWFGLRGGLIAAAAVSMLVMPFIFTGDLAEHSLASEWVEILFYFAIAGVTGALFDRELLTRRQHQETQLQLERSHKLSMVGQMAASVAHEIKNPLASIKGSVEIVCDDSTPDNDRQEFKQIITNEIRRVDGTIKEFLDFARPRESKFERLNLSEVVRNCLRQVETQASQNHLTIKSTIDDDIFATGDREKLHQVLLNLMLNAIEASIQSPTTASPDRGSIDVSLGHKEDRVYLEVTDHGCGMEDSEIEKVFDPFYTTKATGSGLGLSIVKAIIDNHGGTIGVQSIIDQGTTVQINLPSHGG